MANQRELVEQLFAASLALKPVERAAFLDGACGNDPKLRSMVDELLLEDARAGSFLEHPPFGFPETSTATPVDGNRTSSTPIPAGQLRPGQVLNERFVIVRRIAKGGMGEVYEAEDRLLPDAHVALKTILPHISGDPDLQQRFKREVLIAHEVNHPNLCPIYDIFHSEQEPGFLYLTMKLLPGRTLAARLREPVPLSAVEAGLIVRKMAAGIAAIHAADIIHRDIKPNNVMLDGCGADIRLWITDFGLARATEFETTLSGRGMVAGTPEYMAPELFQGHPPSQASDLYSFGVVMHEVFTGQKPVMTPDRSRVIVSPKLNSPEVPPFYVKLVTECLDHDPAIRCEAFEHALESIDPRILHGRSSGNTRKVWTRRRFVAAAATAVFAIGGGTWWEWDKFDNLLHPLPGKRFIALLNWPRTSDVQVTPMLTGVLSAIKSELSRIEAYDRDLFVISPEEISTDLSGAKHLREVCDPLGANLVLAASGLPGVKHFQLVLRLLDPSSSHPLREKKLTCALDDITSLPDKAVYAAASLLNLGRYLQSKEQIGPGTQSAGAFTAFQTAETLMKQPNDAGLDGAIDKYKEAIQLDPNYALAHAELAQAYVHMYGIRHDTGALDLARGNCDRALELNPNLVDGYIARAVLLEQTGDEQGALSEFGKALAIDPSNPDTLLLQAGIYTRLNRWKDAEQTYGRVIKERPNSWVTYNQLGFALHGEGKYQEAIKAFREASVAAPRSSLPLSNLGGEYLQVGDFTSATEALKRSLSLVPTDLAAANTSLALRYQGRNQEALPFALQAVALSPTEDTNWLELGDCYSSLHNRRNEATNAYRRAAEETERRLQTDPTNGVSWMMLSLYRVKSGSPKPLRH